MRTEAGDHIGHVRIEDTVATQRREIFIVKVAVFFENGIRTHVCRYVLAIFEHDRRAAVVTREHVEARPIGAAERVMQLTIRRLRAEHFMRFDIHRVVADRLPRILEVRERGRRGKMPSCYGRFR